MRTTVAVAACVTAWLGARSAAAQAYSPAQASVETRASVTIVDPSALGKEAELSLAPLARPSAAAGVTAQALDGRYEVSGMAGDSFNLAMPSTLRLVRAGGADEVLLQLTPSGAVSILPGAYGARSTGSVAVQGKVGVSPGAAPGLYKGSFPVILSLQ